METLAGYRARALRRYRLLRLRGDDVECPCCGGSFREFMPGRDGNNPICPRCGAQARHRALWLYLHERTNLYSEELSVLHFAPERALRRIADAPNLRYLSADLDAPDVMEHFDITAIPHPDDSFDVILCIHVLEHVPDDRAAMSELARVLRPGGWAIVMVPLDLGLPETLRGPGDRHPRGARARLLAVPTTCASTAPTSRTACGRPDSA